MVHITAGSTLPPTWTCSSASGPRDVAWNKPLGGAAGRALQLHLQPMRFKWQAKCAALLDILAGALEVAHIDLEVGQLQPGPGQPRLLGHALVGALEAGLDGLFPAPVARQNGVDQVLFVRRVDNDPAVGRDAPQVVEVGVRDLMVGPEVGIAANEPAFLVVVAVDWPEMARGVGPADLVSDDDWQPVRDEGLNELVRAGDAAGGPHAHALGVKRHAV